MEFKLLAIKYFCVTHDLYLIIRAIKKAIAFFFFKWLKSILEMTKKKKIKIKQKLFVAVIFVLFSFFFNLRFPHQRVFWIWH